MATVAIPIATHTVTKEAPSHLSTGGKGSCGLYSGSDSLSELSFGSTFPSWDPRFIPRTELLQWWWGLNLTCLLSLPQWENLYTCETGNKVEKTEAKSEFSVLTRHLPEEPPAFSDIKICYQPHLPRDRCTLYKKKDVIEPVIEEKQYNRQLSE